MTFRILVTGAAGSVGRATLRALATRPEACDITAFDRDNPAARRALKPFRGRVRAIFGDITRPGDLAGAVAGADAVLHLAAVLPPLADAAPGLAEKVNHGGTRALVAALEGHAPGAFLVHASSVAVYGDRLGSPEIRVGDPLRPAEGDHYAATKIAAEDAVRTSGLDWTIFRLTAVMDGHRLSPLMFHMPLDTLIEIVTAADAGRAFAAAPFARARLAGRVFNLGGGPACRTRYRDFLAARFAQSGLGRFDLPEAAFATRNFHCGALADGDELEEILHFRRDDLAAYYRHAVAAQPPWQKRATRLLRRRIKARLLAASEPLAAIRTGDAALCARFFGEAPPRLPS